MKPVKEMTLEELNQELDILRIMPLTITGKQVELCH